MRQLHQAFFNHRLRCIALYLLFATWGEIAFGDHSHEPPVAVDWQRQTFAIDVPSLLPILIEAESSSSFPGLPIQAGGSLTFNFTPRGQLVTLQGSNPTLYNNVVNGFVAAGNYWSSQFTDDITVNIDIDFPALGAGILGQAGSETIGAFYSDVRSALIADATTAADDIAAANLPAGPTLSFLTNNEVTGALEIDGNGSGNNSVLDVNRANAKALGLPGIDPNDSLLDAEIGFSSNFSWDFDRSNGITAGQFDFVGVAIHEIGHAMGFVSGVDIVDIASEPNGPFAPAELDDFRVFTVLDLFRRGERNLGGLDFAYGGVGTNNPYFSIDGGVTSLATFSTGQFNGDSRQASHWKDNLGWGIMDPTLGSGTLAVVSELDLRAMDVIGFNPVPEGSTFALSAGFAAIFAVTRRRARRRTQRLC